MVFKTSYFKNNYRVWRQFRPGFLILFFSSASLVAQPLVSSQSSRISNSEASYPLNGPLQFLSPESGSFNRGPDGLGGIKEEVLRDKIQDFALRFIGKPYRNSGKSPATGFDCSGFTGFIFRNFGLKLKASSTGQAMEGKKVSVHKASVGDLAFFGRRGRKGRMLVNHAAIVISRPGEPLAIIHSASNKGIIITKVEESRYWKNSLLFVRNVIKS